MDEVFKVVNVEPEKTDDDHPYEPAQMIEAIEDEQTAALALGVTIKDRQAVVSSRDIARVFGKGHYHVLRDIRELECSKEFNESNFGFVEYTDQKGESRPEVLMSKDGFVFLVMGYTGRLAARFKEAYIAEFNRMEAELQGSLEQRVRAIAREEAQKQIDSQGPLISVPMNLEFATDPSLDPKVSRRMRVIYTASQIPAGVPIGEWYAKLAEAEEISVPTVYRWMAEAAEEGRIVPGRAKPRFNVHVTVNGVEFDVQTRVFSPSAVEWLTKALITDPDAEVKALFARLSELAKEQDWSTGSLASFYRLAGQIDMKICR
jgi:Rha family phage regulatory protein